MADMIDTRKRFSGQRARVFGTRLAALRFAVAVSKALGYPKQPVIAAQCLPDIDISRCVTRFHRRIVNRGDGTFAFIIDAAADSVNGQSVDVGAAQPVTIDTSTAQALDDTWEPATEEDPT